MRGIVRCAICLDGEEDTQWAALRCGHIFHCKCLQDSLKVKPRCPSCRQAAAWPSSSRPPQFITLYAVDNEADTENMSDSELQQLVAQLQKEVHAKSSKVIDYEVSNLHLTEELKRNDDKYQELKRKAKMEKLQAQGMLDKQKKDYEDLLAKSKQQEEASRRQQKEAQETQLQLHSECERLRLRVLSMERSGGLKKYEGSAYSDKDLEDFLRSCGDDKESLVQGLAGTHAQYKKLRLLSEELQHKLEEAQRSHTQELANLTRLMQHKIDAVKKDCWEKQLKINKLDAQLLQEQQQQQEAQAHSEDDDAFMAAPTPSPGPQHEEVVLELSPRTHTADKMAWVQLGQGRGRAAAGPGTGTGSTGSRVDARATAALGTRGTPVSGTSWGSGGGGGGGGRASGVTEPPLSQKQQSAQQQQRQRQQPNMAQKEQQQQQQQQQWESGSGAGSGADAGLPRPSLLSQGVGLAGSNNGPSFMGKAQPMSGAPVGVGMRNSVITSFSHPIGKAGSSASLKRPAGVLLNSQTKINNFFSKSGNQ